MINEKKIETSRKNIRTKKKSDKKTLNGSLKKINKLQKKIKKKDNNVGCKKMETNLVRIFESKDTASRCASLMCKINRLAYNEFEKTETSRRCQTQEQ